MTKLQQINEDIKLIEDLIGCLNMALDNLHNLDYKETEGAYKKEWDTLKERYPTLEIGLY